MSSVPPGPPFWLLWPSWMPFRRWQTWLPTLGVSFLFLILSSYTGADGEAIGVLYYLYCCSCQINKCCYVALYYREGIHNSPHLKFAWIHWFKVSHQLALLVRVGPQGLLCLLIPNSENASLHINVCRKLVCSVKDVFVCVRIKYSLWMNLALTRDMGRINEANCIFSIWTPPGGGLIDTSSCIWMRQIIDIWQAGDGIACKFFILNC